MSNFSAKIHEQEMLHKCFNCDVGMFLNTPIYEVLVKRQEVAGYVLKAGPNESNRVNAIEIIKYHNQMISDYFGICNLEK